MSLSKIFTGGLIVSGLVAGWLFIKRMTRLKLNLEAIPNATLYKASFSGVTIKVDVVIKNPSNGSLIIKFPFVKLIYKSSIIGSSQVVNKDIKILPYSEVLIERIMITLPLLSTLSVGYALVKTLIDRKKNASNPEPVKIGVMVITTAMVSGVQLPFSETYDIPIVS